MIRSIPSFILSCFLIAWLPVCFVPRTARAQAPDAGAAAAGDAAGGDVAGDDTAGGAGGTAPTKDDDAAAGVQALEEVKRITVAVAAVEVDGDINELLPETLREGLKSEVRQNDNLDIILNNPVTLTELIGFRSDDCRDYKESIEDQAHCFDSIAEMLGAQSFAFATLKPVFNGYEVNTFWYVSTEAGGSGEVDKFFRSEITGQKVIGNDFDFENAVPNLAFRLFGGNMNTLIVDSNVKGAQVWLVGGQFGRNGQQVGITPYQNERLAVGEQFHIVIKKQGFKDWSTEKAKEYGGEKIEIQDGPPIEVSADLEVEDTGLKPLSSALALLGWTITGTGVAFLIAGMVTGIMVSTTQSDFDAELVQDLTFDRLERANDLRSSGHDLADTTNVLLGVGGALTVVGVTLIILGYTEVFEEKEEEVKEEEDSQAFYFNGLNVYVNPDGGMGGVIGFSF